MTRRLMRGTVALAVAAAVWPAAASGQTPAQDSVTGTASWEAEVPEPTTITLAFDVFSGPSGEDASGTVVASAGGQPVGVGDVTCLHVAGNRAVIGLGGQLGSVYLVVVDGGIGGQDAFGPAPAFGLAECATFTGEVTFMPFTAGDVVVFDAQPFPTTKDQCKKGGWRQFGFKNQGQCVASVAGRPGPRQA